MGNRGLWLAGGNSIRAAEETAMVSLSGVLYPNIKKAVQITPIKPGTSTGKIN